MMSQLRLSLYSQVQKYVSKESSHKYGTTLLLHWNKMLWDIFLSKMCTPIFLHLTVPIRISKLGVIMVCCEIL